MIGHVDVESNSQNTSEYSLIDMVTSIPVSGIKLPPPLFAGTWWWGLVVLKTLDPVLQVSELGVGLTSPPRKNKPVVETTRTVSSVVAVALCPTGDEEDKKKKEDGIKLST